MKEIRSTMKDINIKAQEGKVVDLDFQLSLLATNIMTEMALGKRQKNFFQVTTLLVWSFNNSWMQIVEVT
jgi:hypothetical protein